MAKKKKKKRAVSNNAKGTKKKSGSLSPSQAGLPEENVFELYPNADSMTAIRELPPDSIREMLKAVAKDSGGKLSDTDRALLDSLTDDDIRSFQLGKGLPETYAPPSARDIAQEYMYQAWEAKTAATRIKRAAKALAIYPLCSDAMVLIADETASSDSEALAMYSNAVGAAREDLGDDFVAFKGKFWGVFETRPFMRAAQQLAHELWDSGYPEDAIEQLEELLELNPIDNQGNRYILLSWLLETRDDEAAEELIDEYSEDASSNWLWSRALLAFRKNGDSPEATKLLKQAYKQNKHVPDYLLAKKDPPDELPASYSHGSPDEAILYVLDFEVVWVFTPNALDWLKQHV
ncbi:MAG TPA: hypothetical protein ENH10_06960 [Bacteroidetes bacterium]|nr:ST7 protein [bacterium BMS3Bbin04]HDO65756.1 hypothetical protein [Bacteroidota bacterium]HEX04881.1 hypothetical protein [Bacteroidota bacterium]